MYVNYARNFNWFHAYVKGKSVTTQLHVDEELKTVQNAIMNSQYSLAVTQLTQIKNFIEASTLAVSRYTQAKESFERTKKLSFFWANKPDTSVIDLKMSQLEEGFAERDFDKSRVLSGDVIELSRNVTNTFWINIKRDRILYILYFSYSKLLPDFQESVFLDIGKPIYYWKEYPTLVSVDLNRSIANVKEIEIEKQEITKSILLDFSDLLEKIQMNENQLLENQSKKQDEPKKQEPVDFNLDITKIDIPAFSLCATVTAKLTNTGTDTAHDVQVRFEVLSKIGNIIKINGQQYITDDIGNLTGKSDIARSKKLCVSYPDGLDIQSNGGTVVIKITSKEKTVEIKKELKI